MRPTQKSPPLQHTRRTTIYLNVPARSGHAKYSGNLQRKRKVLRTGQRPGARVGSSRSPGPVMDDPDGWSATEGGAWGDGSAEAPVPGPS